MTTHTFDISNDATATFSSYTWVLSDKVDPGTEVIDSDLDEYAGATLINDFCAGFRQINEVFLGSRSATAMRVGGSGGVTPASTADNLIVGSSTAGADTGITIMSPANCRLLMGNTAGNGQAGLVYIASSSLMIALAGGSSVLNIRDDGASNRNISPATTNIYSCGTTSLRWSNTFTTLLNASGAVTLSSTVDITGVLTMSSHIVMPTGPRIIGGTGTPEGVVTAPVGSLFLRDSAGVSTNRLYTKRTGTGNTGWVSI